MSRKNRKKQPKEEMEFTGNQLRETPIASPGILATVKAKGHSQGRKLWDEHSLPECTGRANNYSITLMEFHESEIVEAKVVRIDKKNRREFFKIMCIAGLGFSLGLTGCSIEKRLVQASLKDTEIGIGHKLYDEFPLPESSPAILDFEINHNVYVNNSTETWGYSGHYTILYPSSLRGTVNAVKYALKSQKNLRCLGEKHSFSLCAQTDGLYVSLAKTTPYSIEKHNQTVGDIDATPLFRLRNKDEKENYFNALGGMSLAMVNHILCPDNSHQIRQFGRKRLLNMPGVDTMTIAGAISTGTHGSGGKVTSLHDAVRSIELVSGDGTVYRVEPADGITDPDRHLEWYSSHPKEVQVELIQNDDVFYSCLVNMGCFGIIYSVIFEVQEMEILHQDTVYHKEGWQKIADEQLMEAVLPDETEQEYYYSILLNPYIKKGAKGRSVQTKTAVPYCGQEEPKGARKRPWFPHLSANVGVMGKLIRFMANMERKPKTGMIESALKVQHDVSGKGGGYTDLSYKVWNGGLAKLKRYGTAIEFCFPTTKTPDVMKKVFSILEEAGTSDKGCFLNAPVSIRFARPSKAYLAQNYYQTPEGRPVKEWCYLEFIRVNGKSQEDDERETLLFQRLQSLLDKEGGRPHWGLNFEFNFSISKLEELYPKFGIWHENYQFFNATGVFSNEFTRRAGL